MLANDSVTVAVEAPIWLTSPLTKCLSFRGRQLQIAPGLLDTRRSRIYGPWDSFVAQRERPSTLSTGCYPSRHHRA
jgi:hypothetical protein